MTETIRADLNAEQRQAVEHGDGPLLIVAGAGTGKTRVITRRIAALLERDVAPHRILAITFTNKASREMLHRVQSMIPGTGVWVGTFHSFGARCLRISGHELGIDRNFTIVDREDQLSLMRRLLQARGVDPKAVRPQRVIERISTSKSHGLSPDDLRGDAFEYDSELMAELFADYRSAMALAHALDFDDLLLWSRDLLVDPIAGESWRQRFDHVLVDEYQDTNRLQMEMAVALARRSGNLCVCGDPDQSIYSWRGAEIANILDFEKQFPGARVVRLERNYRSSNAILRTASALIANNEQRIERLLYSESREGDPPRLMRHLGDREEADAVARLIQDRRAAGDRFQEMAVLYRTNALSRGFESAFRYHGIPYAVVGAVEFYARREVRDLIAYLRLSVNPHDIEAFRRVLHAPTRGIGQVSEERLLGEAARLGVSPVELLVDTTLRPRLRGKGARGCEELAEIFHWLQGADSESVESTLSRLLVELRYREHLEQLHGEMNADERWENVGALLNEAADFDVSGGESGMLGFLQERALVQDTDALHESSDAVAMMTFHSAKGLEFDTVFLVGLEAQLIPHRRAAEEGGIEEERRLLYVGITRARRTLVLSFAESRFAFGRSEPTVASPFLRELPPDLLQDGHLLAEPSWAAASQDPYVVLEEPEMLEFQIGETVEHDVFGLGRVVECVGSGFRSRLRVRFESGEKLLQQEFARLRKVRGA